VIGLPGKKGKKRERKDIEIDCMVVGECQRKKPMLEHDGGKGNRGNLGEAIPGYGGKGPSGGCL